MAAGEATPRQQRTYGNWRRPERAGIGRLSLGATLLLLGGLIVVLLGMLISVLLALALALVLAVVLAPLAIRDRHGRSLLTRLVARLAWRRQVSSGAYLYRSGPLGRTDHGTCRLPGVAASSTLTEHQDAYGLPFAMLAYPHSNHYVVVLSCDTDGAGLVDQDQVDIWVAHWGAWLRDLATEPGLVGATVTVEAAPDSGVRLHREVRSNTASGAPALAKEMLEEVLADYPAGSAQITTRIALTYSGAARAGHERRGPEEMAVQLGNRLPGLVGGLAMTGAGAARAMTAAQLAEAVRIAYDPAVATLVEEAQGQGGSGLTWDQAGPISTQETWEHYRHDTALSTTWVMSEAPRGEVLSSVLTGLLAPSEDVARKRVTLAYRPHDPAAAARLVERDRKDALFRAGESRIGRARDDASVLAAKQTAEEEARGAGVTRFALYVTATVAAPAHLPRAEAAIDNLSAPARIALRRMSGSQASAFAACLPIGLVIPLHLTIPTAFKDNL
ncbi:SCO6880 family protein [Streptomyces synnematoformans]|uniref:Integral membrane protein n=1 Tax=Streptomyces synnematoformans TaxID=415721 RepID=A0ABN2XFM5_9ACTN